MRCCSATPLNGRDYMAIGDIVRALANSGRLSHVECERTALKGQNLRCNGDLKFVSKSLQKHEKLFVS